MQVFGRGNICIKIIQGTLFEISIQVRLRRVFLWHSLSCPLHIILPYPVWHREERSGEKRACWGLGLAKSWKPELRCQDLRSQLRVKSDLQVHLDLAQGPAEDWKQRGAVTKFEVLLRDLRQDKIRLGLEVGKMWQTIQVWGCEDNQSGHGDRRLGAGIFVLPLLLLLFF